MEGEKGIHKLAKLNGKKNKDLSQVKCNKDENQCVMTTDNEIKEGWKSYFDRLFNLEHQQDFHNFPTQVEISVGISISEKSEVKKVLKHMNVGKVCGPNGIPI